MKQLLKIYIGLLMKYHHRPARAGRKILSICIGALLFLVLLPGVLFLIADQFGIAFSLPAAIQVPLELGSIGTGLVFLTWSAYAQLTIGGGTPAPSVPTRRLVVRGPYRYTRNPIEFGALWYYFGIGTLLGSLFHGLTCMLLAFIMGTLYHKGVEERELLERFGAAYEQYRQTTPFLIPRWKSRKHLPDEPET